jgi:hypothetical protein
LVDRSAGWLVGWLVCACVCCGWDSGISGRWVCLCGGSSHVMLSLHCYSVMVDCAVVFIFYFLSLCFVSAFPSGCLLAVLGGSVLFLFWSLDWLAVCFGGASCWSGVCMLADLLGVVAVCLFLVVVVVLQFVMSVLELVWLVDSVVVAFWFLVFSFTVCIFPVVGLIAGGSSVFLGCQLFFSVLYWVV